MNHPHIQLDLNSVQLSINTINAHTGEPTDPYKAEAAKVFVVPEDQVTPQQREWVKRRMYLNAYGANNG